MKSLAERIREGEAAIARAKAEGRDVTQWEHHLEQLRREAMSNNPEPKPEPPADLHPLDGKIIALLIDSTVLGAEIWFSFDQRFDPMDGRSVYYDSELPHLRTKTPETLKEIQKIKVTFGPGSMVKQ